MRSRAEIDAEYAESMNATEMLVGLGKTSREISDELGITIGCVRQRVSKIGLQCRSHLEKLPLAPLKNGRPYAMGHRFNPDLHCGACGVSWAHHQGTAIACGNVTEMQTLSPEPVESREVCCNGHALGSNNLYVSPKGKRQCRKCRSDNDRKRQGGERMQNRVPMTHCQRGHEFTEANTYRSPNDPKRQCRACKQMRAGALREKKREERG